MVMALPNQRGIHIGSNHLIGLRRHGYGRWTNYLRTQIYTTRVLASGEPPGRRYIEVIEYSSGLGTLAPSLPQICPEKAYNDIQMEVVHNPDGTAGPHHVPQRPRLEI